MIGELLLDREGLRSWIRGFDLVVDDATDGFAVRPITGGRVAVRLAGGRLMQAPRR